MGLFCPNTWNKRQIHGTTEHTPMSSPILKTFSLHQASLEATTAFSKSRPIKAGSLFLTPIP